MTSPKHATTTDSGRTYSIPNFPEIEFISVTTVLNVVSKPALVNWAAKLSAERAVNDENAWNSIQQEEGNQAAINYIKSAPRESTSAAAERGSRVHHYCEHWPCDVPDEYLPWMQQYEAFLKEYEPEFLARERTVCNPTEGYAGTLDAVCRIGDKNVLCDIKTGGCYPSTHSLQLAAYRYATHYVEGGCTFSIDYPVDAGMVLELKPRSFKVHWLRCEQYAFNAFLDAKRLYYWVNVASKSAEGQQWK